MRNMLKKATGLILAAALTFSLAAPAAAAGSSSAAGASSPSPPTPCMTWRPIPDVPLPPQLFQVEGQSEQK